jgi:hypothetical protein
VISSLLLCQQVLLAQLAGTSATAQPLLAHQRLADWLLWLQFAAAGQLLQHLPRAAWATLQLLVMPLLLLN